MSIFSKSKMEYYDENEINELEKYIKDTFGEFTNVFHEIVSPDIHVDVVQIPPAENRNYYTLVTMGMGAHRMNVPKKFRKYKLEYTEVAICLPPDWDFKTEDEKHYWPIWCLKDIARLPIYSDTWLGSGHTVFNKEPYAENTKFCCSLLLYAIDHKQKRAEPLEMRNGKVINFYSIFPIYEEEMNFKLSHDASAFLDLVDDADMTPVININRKNYCADV